MKYIKDFKKHFQMYEYDIKKYSLNKDGSIDVNEDVQLQNLDMEKIPLIFNRVNGFFNCSHNSLTSLKNAPKYVDGIFDCNYNKLISLQYSPKEINVSFNCYRNKLTSLEYSPESVNGNFICSENFIFSLEHAPKLINDKFICSGNPIAYIYYLYVKKFENIELFNEYKIIKDNIIPIFLKSDREVLYFNAYSDDGFGTTRKQVFTKLVDKFLGYSLQEIRELIIGCKEVQDFINGPEEPSPIKTALDYTLNHYKKERDPLKNLYTEQLIVGDAVKKCISEKLSEVDAELGLVSPTPKIDPLVSLTEQTLGKKCDKTNGYDHVVWDENAVANERNKERLESLKSNDGLSKITKKEDAVIVNIPISKEVCQQFRREQEMKKYADQIDAQVDKSIAFPMGAKSGILRKVEGTISKQLTNVIDTYNAISNELDSKEQQETPTEDLKV